ncbi:hypothetical protein HII31_05051 [Pseudocercospora fuligena]|uniref:Uncharacterized protein n=1 Tax=Pseudocercospora fuligena TaxID=685502 RepID=A0A8H6VKC8_9PEZI|nr:hypothetical protein HII31_05051 [Pseudocercospora fuligena]
MARTPSKKLTATLNYYLEPDKGGDAVFYPGTAGDKRRRQAPVRVEVEDMRACREQPALDTQGFQLIEEPSCEKKFDDEERIKSIYHDECAQIVKR